MINILIVTDMSGISQMSSKNVGRTIIIVREFLASKPCHLVLTIRHVNVHVWGHYCSHEENMVQYMHLKCYPTKKTEN